MKEQVYISLYPPIKNLGSRGAHFMTENSALSRRAILIRTGAIVMVGTGAFMSSCDSPPPPSPTPTPDPQSQNKDFTYTGHTDSVLAVAWSPDGQLVASGSQDGTVQVWNANGGSGVYPYQGH